MTELSPADKKKLGSLVGKYGSDAIIEAAKRVRIPRRGLRRDLSKWEDVEWIETEAFRYGGKKEYGALKRATRDLFERRYPPKRRTDKNWKSFQKHIKNARDEWRRISRLIKAAREAKPSKRPSNSSP